MSLISEITNLISESNFYSEKKDNININEYFFDKYSIDLNKYLVSDHVVVNDIKMIIRNHKLKELGI